MNTEAKTVLGLAVFGVGLMLGRAVWIDPEVAQTVSYLLLLLVAMLIASVVARTSNKG